MSVTTSDFTPPAPPHMLRVWTAVGIALAAAVVVVTVPGLGPLSLPGMAVLAIATVAAGVALIATAPQALLVIGPALIPLPVIGRIFPSEIVFLVFTLLAVLSLLETRPPWALRLERLEVATIAFLAWATFSGLWCNQRAGYVYGVHRLALGVVSLWIGLRLVRFVKRPWFEAGLLVMAASLTAATLRQRMSFGYSEKRLMFNRASATDLGWGTSNFIATLLLLLAPPLLEVALRSRQRILRLLAWPTLAGIALLQVQIASRAATVLFVIAVLVQLGWGRIRHGWALLLAGAAALTGLLLSPLGEGLLARFTNLRDLGSMVIRVWYFREAWQRTLDNLPWGIGLGEGVSYADKLQNIDPHNYWLAVSSELGIPGVALWIVVLVLLHSRLVRVARTPGWETVGRALLIAFWASQLHTLVEPTFQGLHYQYLYFWMMGAYLGYAHHAASAEASAAESSRRYSSKIRPAQTSNR